jgi:hypothetical protein
MTLVRTIIERFATKEAQRGHTVEYVGSCINCNSIDELIEEVSLWIHETEGIREKSASYILSVLDTITD